ncbi:general substrate transporter [Lentinula guzmanii]|uniref:General substrate transporter n=1 Tax=Lentinula guzmanii TaxID=2804957 RepID=A0AA38JED3_9AGAR|nr:general substrate transporter [Lentinula guzmanii]
MGSIVASTRTGLFQNVRVYWLAFIAYWGILLFGYDTGGVVGNLYFEEIFGIANSTGSINTKKSDMVSSNVVSVLQAGAFFGALLSAPISAKFGRKWPLFIYTLTFAIGAILTIIPSGNNPRRGLSEIYAGRVISGFGIGAITAVSPAFVSECSPKEVRGRITGLFQVMVASGIGVGLHVHRDSRIWRIPFGLQLVPAGLMALGLLTVKESPRYLASVGRNDEAINNLAYLRRSSAQSEPVILEMAEIEAAIQEEREARRSSDGGKRVVKVVTVSIFIAFGVEKFGRKRFLFISSMGMGILFFIIGALLKTYPPPATSANDTSPSPSRASQAMAAMLYLEGVCYVIGWGPLPWIYVSEIFPTRTRHYGLSFASASQWLWNFVISKQTPIMKTELGYKLFLMFASLNIGALTIFALLIPETKGKSLEEMDIFGAVDAKQRQEHIIANTLVRNQQPHEKSPRESISLDNTV